MEELLVYTRYQKFIKPLQHHRNLDQLLMRDLHVTIIFDSYLRDLLNPLTQSEFIIRYFDAANRTVSIPPEVFDVRGITIYECVYNNKL